MASFSSLAAFLTYASEALRLHIIQLAQVGMPGTPAGNGYAGRNAYAGGWGGAWWGWWWWLWIIILFLIFAGAFGGGGRYYRGRRLRNIRLDGTPGAVGDGYGYGSGWGWGSTWVWIIIIFIILVIFFGGGHWRYGNGYQ